MHRLLPLLFVLLLVACNTDDQVDDQPTLVVEGWIDNDGFPTVLLTTTVPITKKPHKINELGDHILRWARVAVNDGEQEVVLTGKLDRRYFPPYVYTSGRMRGVVGRTYRLTVDYGDFHAEAETSIPPAPTLDSLRLRPLEDNDTLFQVRAYFHDDLSEPRFYKFFTSMGTDSRMFLSSYMQTLSNEVFDPNAEQDIAVYKGRLVTRRDGYVPYFEAFDTVMVKFVAMDRQSFLMWNQLEHNMTLGGFPMTSAKENPHFNVRGGIGYWCGYGATFYPVIVRDSLP